MYLYFSNYFIGEIPGEKMSCENRIIFGSVLQVSGYYYDTL